MRLKDSVHYHVLDLSHRHLSFHLDDSNIELLPREWCKLYFNRCLHPFRIHNLLEEFDVPFFTVPILNFHLINPYFINPSPYFITDLADVLFRYF